MAKRFVKQFSGERKKPKLDVTILDHNFPLSRNVSPNRDDKQDDAWGDDNDDEILLMASQACEEAEAGPSNASILPDYSMCMQPASTSTQLWDTFNHVKDHESNLVFKKPSHNQNFGSTLDSKARCHRVSSPLPGLSSKIPGMPINNIPEDFIVNNKTHIGKDSDFFYKQLLQMQEENAKLKSENGKLLEKCVTKEGEASILRTQLKSCQVAVDNARLDRLRAHERTQGEWTEKLTAAHTMLQEMKNQLDFKNLEVISVKERCRMLESSKVKLTQVTVPSHDRMMSQRHNNMVKNHNDSFYAAPKKVKVATVSAQTECKPVFSRLKKCYRSHNCSIKDILPLILEPASEEQCSLLEFNEKLQTRTEHLQSKCKIFNTFHRIPRTPMASSSVSIKEKTSLTCLYQDLSSIASGCDKAYEELHPKYLNVLLQVKAFLSEVLAQLESISKKVTTAFQREMDERYMEASSTFTVVQKPQLLNGSAIFKDEQGISVRRAVATLACIWPSSPFGLEHITSVEHSSTDTATSSQDSNNSSLISLVLQVCLLIDSSYCAVAYSGLLLSIIYLMNAVAEKIDNTALHEKIFTIARTTILSRPISAVVCEAMNLLRRLSLCKSVLPLMCSSSSTGNLKLDYDQGVVLYKKESCFLQILLRQIESAIKSAEAQGLTQEVAHTMQHLINFYRNASFMEASWCQLNQNAKCECPLQLAQVIVYALQVCATMLRKHTVDSDSSKIELEAICRCGLAILYLWIVRDIEFNSQLGYNEGHFNIFVELYDQMKDRIGIDEIQGNVLTELMITLQPSSEHVDAPDSPLNQVVDSFSRFTTVD